MIIPVLPSLLAKVDAASGGAVHSEVTPVTSGALFNVDVTSPATATAEGSGPLRRQLP